MKRDCLALLIYSFLFPFGSVFALPDPSAWWKLDESSGEIAYDSSGNNHHGTLMNMDSAECWVSLNRGNALWLDGVNDYAEAQGYTGIAGGNDRTICAWIQTNAPGGILSYGAETAGTGGKWNMSVNAEGKLDVTVWDGRVYGSTVLVDGLWHHVTAVLNDADHNGLKQVKDIRLYVDGRPETLTYAAGPDTLIDTLSQEPVHLGAFDGYGGNGIIGYLAGVLDDVRMYEAALSGIEINQLITDDIDTKEADAWWLLDEGEGTAVHDNSGNENNGMLYGGPGWAPGVFGTAIRFDGVDDYMEADGYAGISGGNDRTICMWIQAAGPGGILSYGAETTGNGGKWNMSVNAEGKLDITVWNGRVYGSTKLTEGLWHHITAVLGDMDGNGLKQVWDIRLYVDGEPEILTYAVGPDTVIETLREEPVHLGAWDGNGDTGIIGYLPGMLDDVRMYDAALSAVEIQQIIQGPLDLIGNGTPEDPFRIFTADQLVLMGTKPYLSDQCFLLMNDIDLGEYTFNTAVIAPDISTEEGYQGAAFTGIFDGNGYTIRNLKIVNAEPSYANQSRSSVSSEYRGLFGFVRWNPADINQPGVIKNLSLEGYSIAAGNYTGGLAGYVIRSEIIHCTTRGTIQRQRDLGGGTYIGGLAGRLQRSVVQDCHTEGSIQIEDSCNCVGGLIGSAWEPESEPEPPVLIESCSADVSLDIFAAGDRIGGLIGSNEYGGIYTCRADGDILFLAPTRQSNFENTGFGGLIGINTGGPVHDCHATGSLKGGSYLGPAGGLIGNNQSYPTSVIHCSASGDVKALSYGQYLGGLIGMNSNGDVLRCFASGDIYGGSSGTCLGGLIGSCGFQCLIENCYTNGDVIASSASQNVGGLIGSQQEGGLRYCYASGDVKGKSSIRSIGGLAGIIEYHNYSVFNCFWDTQVQTYGISRDAGSTDDIETIYGQPTNSLQKKKTYTDAAWWFKGDPRPSGNEQRYSEGVWIIQEGEDYPRLKWEQPNQPPEADAGTDQTIYADLNGFAEVQLDRSASSDPDGDELTGLWRWEIDGQSFTDSSVNPLISLPVGEHTFTLTVNDGFVDSETDKAVITVIGPMEAKMMFIPQTLNSLFSGSFVMTVLTLPAGVSSEDLDESESWKFLPGGLSARYFWTVDSREGEKVIAVFDKDSLISAIGLTEPKCRSGWRPDGMFSTEAEVTVRSKLKTGQIITGTDTIRVIHLVKPKPKEQISAGVKK